MVKSILYYKNLVLKRLVIFPKTCCNISDHEGHIALTDKSPAEDIYAIFGVSKKTFKKAVGDLYKKRVVALEEKGIRLVRP